MNQPVKKNNDGTYWVSADFHLHELKKYEEQIEAEKKVTKYYKALCKELENENKALRQKIVDVLKI